MKIILIILVILTLTLPLLMGCQGKWHHVKVKMNREVYINGIKQEWTAPTSMPAAIGWIYVPEDDINIQPPHHKEK